MGSLGTESQLRLLKLMLQHRFQLQSHTLTAIERYSYTEFTNIRLEGERIIAETPIFNFARNVLIIEKDGQSHLEFHTD